MTESEPRAVDYVEEDVWVPITTKHPAHSRVYNGMLRKLSNCIETGRVEREEDFDPERSGMWTSMATAVQRENMRMLDSLYSHQPNMKLSRADADLNGRVTPFKGGRVYIDKRNRLRQAPTYPQLARTLNKMSPRQWRLIAKGTRNATSGDHHYQKHYFRQILYGDTLHGSIYSFNL